MENIDDILVDGRSAYDRAVLDAIKVIKFRGKSIAEWEEEVALPEINDDATPYDLKNQNISYLNISETIMANYAFCKAATKACEAKFNMAMIAKQKEIKDALEQEFPDKKRIIAADTLKMLAENECNEEKLSLVISEIFLTFWESQYHKLRLLNDRLSGLGYLASLERN